MSFSRFGWDGSDVYVFEHVGGFIQCCGCSLAKPDNPHEIFGFAELKTPREALAHLAEHEKVGDNVTRAVENITAEYEDLDVTIEPYVQSEESRARVREIMRKAFEVDISGESSNNGIEGDNDNE